MGELEIIDPMIPTGETVEASDGTTVDPRLQIIRMHNQEHDARKVGGILHLEAIKKLAVYVANTPGAVELYSDMAD